jgi:hypothetical protein
VNVRFADEIFAITVPFRVIKYLERFGLAGAFQERTASLAETETSLSDDGAAGAAQDGVAVGAGVAVGFGVGVAVGFGVGVGDGPPNETTVNVAEAGPMRPHLCCAEIVNL